VDSAVFSNPHMQMDSINYALSYRKDTGGSSWVYLTLFGRVTGTVPQNSHLYILGSSDPKTWDSTGHWANGSYIWKKDHEVFPDAHGCWKLPEFGIAYSGAQGVTFRYYPSLLNPQALACITRLRTADIKDNEYDGHTEEQLDKCGVARLGWVSVPTQRLPNAPSPSPRP